MKLPTDKIYHFVIGYVIAASLYFAPIAAVAAAVLIGAAKEGYDFVSSRYFKAPHSPEAMDFLATSAGGLAGIGIPYLLKLGVENLLPLL